MMSLDPADLMLMIEQQERAAEALLPAYGAHAEAKQRQAPLIEAALPRGSPAPNGPAIAPNADAVAASARGAGSVLGLQAMLSQAQSLASNKTAKSTPELAADPLLFKIPLTKPGDVWDSIKSTENGRMEIFLRQLPNYSLDATRGCNAVVIRCQMTSLAGFDRQFAAVNIGRAPGEREAAAALSKDLLGHVYWRVDPVKLGREDTYKYRWGQTCKQGGRWSNDLKKERALSALNWPFKTDRPFFLRLILDPRGLLSYVDGKFMSYTPYPGGQGPSEGEALYLQLPLAGDAGEKPTWKVLSAHWGSCRTDTDAEREMAAYFASPVGQAAIAAMRVESEDELFVTGLPPTATDQQVLDAFRPYGAVAARRDPKTPGAALVKLGPTGRHISAVVSDTDRKVSVAGTLVSVKRALRQFQPQAPPAAGAAGGSMMQVGLAPYAAAAQMHSGISPTGSGGATTGSRGGGGMSAIHAAPLGHSAGYSSYTPGSMGAGSDAGAQAYNPTSPAYS